MGGDENDRDGSKESSQGDSTRRDSPRRSGADTPAPLPPHERTWRHPSEIGFSTLATMNATPINIGRNGRTLIGAVSVAGVVLSVVVVLALRPDSVTTNPHDVIALTNSHLRIASLENSDRLAVENRTGSVPVDNRTQRPPSIPPILPTLPLLSFGSHLIETARSMSGIEPSATTSPETPASIAQSSTPPTAPSRAMGVLSVSGRHILTTTAAVAGVDSIDVRLPDGRVVRGELLSALPELHIAVLSVADESKTSSSGADLNVRGLGIAGSAFDLGQPVMALIETPKEFVVGETLDDIVVALVSHTATDFDPMDIAEGTPLVSKTGHLIGLCTHEAGQLGFVPINLLQSVLAKLLSGVDAAPTTAPNR